MLSMGRWFKGDRCDVFLGSVLSANPTVLQLQLSFPNNRSLVGQCFSLVGRWIYSTNLAYMISFLNRNSAANMRVCKFLTIHTCWITFHQKTKQMTSQEMPELSAPSDSSTFANRSQVLGILTMSKQVQTRSRDRVMSTGIFNGAPRPV